jgi:hypothetical protein
VHHRKAVSHIAVLLFANLNNYFAWDFLVDMY